MYVPPWLDQKKNTLLSGNAGDDKNLHPGLLNWFSRRYSLLFFSFSCFFVFLLLLFFCLFVCLLFICLFFKIWNIYSDTHSTTRLGEWQKSFDLADLRNKNFWPWEKFSDLQCSDYWKCIWESPLPFCMIWSLVPLEEQRLQKLAKKSLSHEKVCPIL